MSRLGDGDGTSRDEQLTPRLGEDQVLLGRGEDNLHLFRRVVHLGVVEASPGSDRDLLGVDTRFV